MPRMRTALALASLTLVWAHGAVVFANPPKLNLYNKVLAANNPVVTQLMAAKQLLLLANHDYAGHRAKAGYEISAAAEEFLHPGWTASQLMMSKKPGQGLSSTIPGPTSAPRNARNNTAVAKATSDSNLLQAAQILNQLQMQIPASQNVVKLHIQAALDEIAIALAIR